MSVVEVLALIAAGVVAGAINTVAGGGSLVMVPALLMLGLPADVANGSSRISILSQCAAGAATFARGGLLPRGAARDILPATIVGAAAGAYVATILPNRIFEPLLLGTMAVMALALLIKPATLAPPPDATPRRVGGRPLAMLGMFAAGFYGGVLQAGAGLVFLAILAGGLRYDLIRANAVKALVMMVYIAVTCVVFIARDKVAWMPALVLAVGTTTGAWLAARVAMSARGLAIVKVVVVVMVIAVCAAVGWRRWG